MREGSKSMKVSKDEVDGVMERYQWNEDEEGEVRVVECYRKLVDMVGKKY
ncbi:hypothetical protein [Bacillus pumilus]|nr:hypothetical protein [Bacillus pumilus]